ncbi:lactococcin 972 family bacteriocin [Pseudonocardia sp. ICBG1293]|uniref:lactococcin 972 family bacteriocin n=1 Tax=Pseudonocardia sp. ICBG1293 TaxID=2844382 RepID=UPI001CCB9582
MILRSTIVRATLPVPVALSLAIGGGFDIAAAAPQKDPVPVAGGTAVAPENRNITINDARLDGIQPRGGSVRNVGGGTWSYGTEVVSAGNKRCYSNYVHPNTYHSSTAVIGSRTNKQFADPAVWSNASAVNSLGQTCRTYWNIY